MRGLKRARRDMWPCGWTLAMSCGPRSSGSAYFCDGSCDTCQCGAGIMIMACSEALGWFPIFKKCGPVVGQNSLDAELGGCGMLMDNLCQWIDNCVC